MTKEVKEKIIEKIQKLLNLAGNNPNENESQAAMLKAQKLMLEYNIEISAFDESGSNDGITEKDVVEESVTKKGRVIWWHKDLAKIVCENFRCKYYLNCKWDYKPPIYKNGKLIKKEEYKRNMNQVQIVFIGLKQDVTIANYVFSFAVNAIEMGADRCYAEFYNQQKPTKGIKQDYTDGFLIGLRYKFKEQVNNIAKEQKALNGETKCTAITLLDLHPVVKKVMDSYDFVNASVNYNKSVQNNIQAIQKGIKDGKNFEGNPNKIGG